MARAGASSLSVPSLRLIGLSALLALSGCVGDTVFDQLNSTDPVGSSFQTALFKNYTYLAKSFGTQAGPSGQAFDSDQAISLTGADNSISGLANAYAQKALAASKGDEVLPEPAPDGDVDADNVRLELLRDLNDGRDKEPDDAARAQADYDCWVMNRRVGGLQSASRACRRSVTSSLEKLERELNPGSAPPPVAQAPIAQTPIAQTPVTQTPIASLTPPAPQGTQFTVEFNSRSVSLTPDALATITQAISAARTGHQSRITVVGHTDADENSQRLSLRRANAVEAALVERGARADAISVSGVGKDDLAVETADHAKEAKNRRVVITLVP